MEITVCGRIAPEQVLDYVKKLKYSLRTEIGVVKFVPQNKSDRIGYEAFFSYLDSRKRYGVVAISGKALKDFYILPLSSDADAPDVLLPFDGPGVEKKHARPNLLLGIVVRSKKVSESTSVPLSTTTTTTASSGQKTASAKAPKQKAIPAYRPSSTSSSSNSATSTPSLTFGGDATGGERSYTPPPKLGSQSSGDDDEEAYDPGASLTPPQKAQDAEEGKA